MWVGTYQMATLKKLVKKVCSLPTEMRLEDIRNILKSFGWKEGKAKGNHFIFRKGDSYITVPAIKGRSVKRIYIKRIRDKLNLEEWYENNKK